MTGRTLVITGGTDGIGRALAGTYLRRGDTVVIIGRDPAKGKAFVDSAGDTGGRARFLPADLSLISENTRVVDRILSEFGTVDALVLCARYFRSTRRETAEGFEETFALFYLSRFLLGEGLVTALERSARPVIMNVAGPGTPAGHVHWDDLGLAAEYDGVAALMQGGKLNDLLGVAFAGRHGRHGRTRYVLFNPGTTATSFAGSYDPETAALIERMKRSGNPVEHSIRPIVAALDEPPAEPLSAFVEGTRISLDDGAFDPGQAIRLDDLTRRLVQRQN
jgi:NAD(P)-dependent dehydrogenase (short-subunit alcohol dehydrogenase family)